MTTATEQELREIFAAIPAPAPPTTWSAGDASPGRGRTRLLPRRRSRLARRWAVAGAVALVVAGLLGISHRGGPTQPSSPSPLSGLTVALLPAAAGLSCSLPISTLSSDHTTGFIVIDHGHATFRPVNTEGTTYVPALARWVPVLPQLVSPNGDSYVIQAVNGDTTTIHVVNANGDRTLLSTSAHINVFAFTPAGILLTDMTPAPGATSPPATLNLELLDPDTGAVRPFGQPLPQLGTVRDAGAGAEAGYLRSGNAIWLTSFDPRTNSTTVRRYDLATRITTDWFDGRADGHGHIQVVGADQEGRPIVQLADSDLFHTDSAHRAGIGVRTLLLTSEHQATVLNGGRVGDPAVAGDLSPLSVTVGGQVWLAADDGAIWLYRASTGLQQVAKVTTSDQGSPGVAISGPCV